MQDSSGFYARLGVAPTATAAEIKSAYRRLAKEFHPDAGGAADQGFRFRALGEAYELLRDPEKRATYDSVSATSSAPEMAKARPRKLEPICCGSCKKVTAQPRYIVFKHVVSFVFATVRTPVQGIYCSSCANKAAIRATLISAAIGWWGVPWGPIYTIGDSIRNALGGTYARNNEERLQCHNAWAFASEGNTRVAYALADKLRSASITEIAESAEALIELLRSQDVKPPAAHLKNSWQLQPKALLLHGLMIAAVPVAIAGYPLISWIHQSGTASVAPTTSLVPPYSPPPVADATYDAPVANIPAVPICAKLPANGQKLAGRMRVGKPGHVLEIQNGSSGDAIVKVRDANNSDRLVVSFFVLQNQTASLKGFPDGSYHIQYAFGPALGQDCKSFTSETAGQFPDIETLTTERVEQSLGVQIRRMHLSYTLYSVPAGNVEPVGLQAAAFEAE